MTAIVSPGFGIEKEVGFGLGSSVEQIALKLFGTVEGVAALIRCPEWAMQEWEVIPRELWKHSKPKGKRVLKFVVSPAGGDNSNVFATIAAVVVSIAAPYLAEAAFGLALGTTGNLIASLAINAGASALLSSLYAPASGGALARPAEDEQRQIANVNAGSNLLARGGRPSRIIGARRISPHDVCHPHRYLEDGREVIEKVTALTGHHEISDIQIDNVKIGNITDAESEIRDGALASAGQSLVTRVTLPTSINSKLTGFSLKADTNRLTDQTTPSNSEPKAISFYPGYHRKVEQYTVRLGLAPFAEPSSASVKVRQPIRILARLKSNPATVIHFDEIHIIGRVLSETLKEIKFRWDDNFGRATASKDFDYEFFSTVPEADGTLSDGSSGPQWQADITRITQTGDGINIQLNEATMPKGKYEFEIVAGMPVRDDQFSSSSYELNGTVESLFLAFDDGSYRVPDGQSGVSAGVTAQFATMIVSERPVQRPGIATVAVRVRDRDVGNVTVQAAAKVMDWNGSQWTGAVTSDNPATHAYNVLYEWLTFFAVDTDLIDQDAFVAWRAECIARGYKVSFIASGQPVSEIIDHMCTAGFATKTVGEGYSVSYFNDKSGDRPTMTFSPRDSRISVKRSFNESPHGIRTKYNDKTDDWNEAEKVFNNPYSNSAIAENEGIDYPSIDDPALIKRRATFDMLRMAHRERRWTVATGPAGHNVKRGELVNIVTDLDNDFTHGFYIKDVLGDRSIAVDRAVPEQESGDLEDVADFAALASVEATGLVSVAHILEPDGVNEYTVVNVVEDVVQLASDLPVSWTVNGTTYSRADLKGTRVSIGPRDKYFKRCIVENVARETNERSILTLVDEAPQIWTEMNRLFG